MTHELRALTGARGIAAWAVVLYHIRLSVAGLPRGVVDVLAKGYLAVDFFFLLSGFVIWLTWHERLRVGGWAAVPSFWWKRFARVWPLHAFMLAVAILLALALRASGRSEPAGFAFAELPLHLLLLQNWGFTGQLSWNVPSWSISAEAGAYLLFPLLVAAVDWRRVSTPLLLLAMAGLFTALHLAMTSAGASTLGWEIARFGLLRCIVEFAAGTAICALWLRLRQRPAAPTLAAFGLSAALIAACWAGALPETLSVPPAFTALLLGLALTAGRRGNPLEGAVHYLGEISYATYLGHFLLFVAFKLLLVTDPHAVPPSLIAFYLLLVLASSVALHHLVELPAQRWLQRRFPAAGTRAARGAFTGA